MKKICPYCGRIGELGENCNGCGYVLGESDKTVKEPRPAGPASHASGSRKPGTNQKQGPRYLKKQDQHLTDLQLFRRLFIFNIKEQFLRFIMSALSIPFFLLSFACAMVILAPGTTYSLRLMSAGILLSSSSIGYLCWITARYLPRKNRRKTIAVLLLVLGVIVSFCGMIQAP